MGVLCAFVSITLLATSCGGGDSDGAANEPTLQQYLDSFSYDADYAESRSELAEASEFVVRARFVGAADGSAFGDKDIELSSRRVLLEFAPLEKVDGLNVVHLELPRPRNVSPAHIESLLLEEDLSDVELYLVERREIPEQEREFWHQVPEFTVYDLTTPQGFIVHPARGEAYSLLATGEESLALKE